MRVFGKSKSTQATKRETINSIRGEGIVCESGRKFRSAVEKIPKRKSALQPSISTSEGLGADMILDEQLLREAGMLLEDAVSEEAAIRIAAATPQIPWSELAAKVLGNDRRREQERNQRNAQRLKSCGKARRDGKVVKK